MLRVRLKESYPNQFWNSGHGVTLAKADRVGKLVDESNYIIKAAITQGFLEIVAEDTLNIIDDRAPVGIKEVVSPRNTVKIKEALRSAVVAEEAPHAD
jgi:hypothetical protein